MGFKNQCLVLPLPTIEKSTATNGASSTLIPTFSAGVTKKYLSSSFLRIEEKA